MGCPGNPGEYKVTISAIKIRCFFLTTSLVPECISCPTEMKPRSSGTHQSVCPTGSFERSVKHAVLKNLVFHLQK